MDRIAKANASTPAFPLIIPDREGGIDVHSGLTKREFMATLMMAHICSMPDKEEYATRYMAEDAVSATDHLLHELETSEVGGCVAPEKE